MVDNENWYLEDAYQASTTLFFNDDERSVGVLIKPLAPMIVNSSTDVGSGTVSLNVQNMLWSVRLQFQDGSILETTGQGRLTSDDGSKFLFSFNLEIDAGTGVHARTSGRLNMSGYLYNQDHIVFTLSGKLCNIKSFAHPFR